MMKTPPQAKSKCFFLRIRNCLLRLIDFFTTTCCSLFGNAEADEIVRL